MTWERAQRDFLRYLKLERRMSDNTLYAYSKDVVKLAKWSIDNNLSPTQISLESLREFLKITQLSPRSQARLVTSIKTFFRYLVYDEVLSVDPTRLLSAPKIGRKLPDFLTAEEIDKMIKVIDRSTPEGERNQVILEVLFACGMRVSELINLHLTDIFPKQGVLRIIGKGDKERLVPIHDLGLKKLNDYIHQVRVHQVIQPGEEDIVFLSRRGKRMARSSIFTFIKNTAISAGIKKNIGPHTFRHSFATALVNVGIDLRIIQQLLGHESITTTEIYAHLSDDKLRKAIDKFQSGGSD